MAAMGNIEREAAEAAGWFRTFEQRVLNDLHRHAPQTPAPTPVTVGTNPYQGEHMSQLSDKIHNIAAIVEHVEENDLGKLAAIMSNPMTAELFAILHQVSGLDLGAILPAVKTILLPYVPQQQQAA